LEQLRSSVIAAVRYFDETQRLYVESNSGAIYCYSEFPAHHYSRFLAADSHAKYFNQHIVGKFPHQIVYPDRSNL